MADTATLRDVKKIAAEMGARVEDDKSFGFHSCRVEAPHRKIWAEGDVHELVDETHQPWKPDYADLLARMKHGLRDCADVDCDWCNGR